MKGEALTVMAVEDDAGDAELLRRNLAQIPAIDLDFMHVPNVEEAEAALSRVGVDLAFVDYLLGPRTGLDLIRNVRASGDLRPIICLTGRGDEHVATEVLHAGADDYLVKSDVTVDSLRRAIEYACARFQRRKVERRNAELLGELQTKSDQLEKNNRRLAELYETAHQFVDNVSHEFRTPLTVIKEFAAIMRDGLAGGLTEQQMEYLSLIIHRSDDLNLMVDDMLDMSRLEAGMLGIWRKNCHVESVIQKVRATLERRAAASKVTLDFALADDLPEVYCDAERIARVIINLTVNAIKFSSEGGRVRITSEDVPAANEVRIAVTDEGPGIQEDQLALIFERFRQVEGSSCPTSRGFGLGLSIARELVQLNLGEITVESKVGQGSTFRFSIPHAQPDRVLERYLRQSWVNDSQKALSIMIARSEDCGDARIDELEGFIHHHMGARDLVFPVGPNRWVCIHRRTAKELPSFISAIERCWSESNRNRPESPLPRLDLQVAGTWTLPAGKPGLLQAFVEAMQAPEMHHAG